MRKEIKAIVKEINELKEAGLSEAAACAALRIEAERKVAIELVGLVERATGHLEAVGKAASDVCAKMDETAEALSDALEGAAVAVDMVGETCGDEEDDGFGSHAVDRGACEFKHECPGPDDGDGQFVGDYGIEVGRNFAEDLPDDELEFGVGSPFTKHGYALSGDEVMSMACALVERHAPELPASVVVSRPGMGVMVVTDDGSENVSGVEAPQMALDAAGYGLVGEVVRDKGAKSWCVALMGADGRFTLLTE